MIQIEQFVGRSVKYGLNSLYIFVIKAINLVVMAWALSLSAEQHRAK